jgi:DNA-binding CsgD family transcriptional regulator
MSILKRLLSRIGLRTNRHPRSHKNIQLRLRVSQIAQSEGRPEREIVTKLMFAGLNKYDSIEAIEPKWESLSKREKTVAILIEKGKTNQDIAKYLSIDVRTVETHVAHIIAKFGVQKKHEVRHMLGVIKKQHWM